MVFGDVVIYLVVYPLTYSIAFPRLSLDLSHVIQRRMHKLERFVMLPRSIFELSGLTVVRRLALLFGLAFLLHPRRLICLQIHYMFEHDVDHILFFGLRTFLDLWKEAVQNDVRARFPPHIVRIF